MFGILGRISIGLKMTLAFAAMLAMIAGLGGFAMLKIGEINALSAEMRTHWLPASQLVGDLHAYTSQFRINQSTHLLASDPDAKRKAEIQIRNARTAIDGLMKDYQPLLKSAEERTAFDDLSNNWSSYNALTDRLVGLSNAADPAATELFKGEALDMFYAVEDNILALVEINTKGGQANSQASDAIYLKTRTMVQQTLGAAIVAAIALMLGMMFSVARPLSRMSDAVRRLTDGDLAVDIPGLRRGDEIGKLATAMDGFKALFAAEQERAHEDQRRAQAEQERAQQTQRTVDAIGAGLAALAKGDLTKSVSEDVDGPLAALHSDFNEAVRQLLSAMSEITNGCGNIRSGTGEIAQASEDLSRRTEHQAESLARTASALEEFTASVRLAASNARQTSERVAIAKHSAEGVGETARLAIEAMKEIETSSREMEDIISTIDGLAFQTNLLALNAGVEAARAGTAGAGFAVVASEVRFLAQKSAEAATKIRHLIATSGKQVASGVSLVEQSGSALRQIVDEVTQVSALIAEIAEAAEQQAAGLHEINNAVSSMDMATQQNAAMVEETTASAQHLSEETSRLAEQVGFFQTGQGLRSSPVAPRASAPAARAMPASRGNLALKQSEDDWEEF